MLRNMVTSLLKHDRIHTTDTRAKVLRGWADHIITLARRGDLHARRQALAIVREASVVHKLFAEAKERFSASNGGYTRIVKLGTRAGDAASMSLIELVAAESRAAQKPSVKQVKKASADVVTPVKIPAAADDAETHDEQQSSAAQPVQDAAIDGMPTEPPVEPASDGVEEKKE